MAAVAAGSAAAQNDDDDVIVVTATRRAEALQDVPLSVSAVRGETLRERGVQNFEEITDQIPGLYIEAPQGASSASIRIRGVGSQGFSSVDPSVGVLVDGVFQPRIGAVFTELQDIERVEVLRGPQGTLFGKNTTAGAIRIITAKPDTEEFSGRLQAVGGNFANAEVRGLVNVPLVEGLLGLRVSGFFAEREGFNDNLLLGTETRGFERSGGRAKLLFTPTENFSALYSGEFTSTDQSLDQGLVRYGTLDSSRAGANSGAPLETVAETLGQTLPEIGPFTREVFQDEQFAEDEIARHILTLEGDVLGHSITSITAYETVESFLPADNDGTPLSITQITSAPETETFTQEIQIASPDDRRFRYLLGFWYQDEEIDSPTLVADGADLATLEGRPQRPPSEVNSDIQNETIAFFGNASFDLTEALTLSGGLRYTEVEKFQNQTISGFPVIDDREETFDQVSGNAELSYALPSGGIVYAAYDRGFKAGGFNRQEVLAFILGPSFALPEERLTFDSETTDAYELGLKTSLWDGRLDLNIAAFYQTFDDFQVTSRFPPSSTIVQNAAQVDTTGIELEFNADLSDSVTLFGATTIMSAEYDDFTNAPAASVDSKSPAASQDLSGETLDNAPEFTANLGLEFQHVFPSLPSVEFTGLGLLNYRSEANLEPTLADDTIQDGYALFDARLGAGPVDGNWKLTLWGRNLFDEEYAVSAGRPSGHSDGLTLVQGLPRTYGVQLDVSF